MNNEKSGLLSLHFNEHEEKVFEKKNEHEENTASIHLEVKLVPKCRLPGQNCTYLSYHELSDSVVLACYWKDFLMKEQDSSGPPN